MARSPRSNFTRKSPGSILATRRKYKNPPIVEATCEFQFVPVDDWNLAYTGLFLEKVKSHYSGKPREQRLLQVDNKRLSGAPVPEPSAVVREITKVLIPTENGKELVAVGPGILSVHVLKPYPGWERYRPQIKEALDVYQQIAKPAGIRRVGIRYVNLIEPTDPDATPGEYLTAPPSELDRLGCSLDTFVLRHEYQYEDEPIKLVVNFARAETGEKKAAYLLDLDVIREWLSDFPTSQRGMNVVDELRQRERDAFEALITQKSRDLFDA